MADKKKKENKLRNSNTEAWADAESYTDEANVNIPSEEAVERAKEYAEENSR